VTKGVLYVFIGADKWRCVLADKKRGARGITFSAGPEEHIRSFIRGSRVKKAYIILSTDKTILRFAKLPLLRAREIDRAVSFLYDGNFPVDKKKYIFGYKILCKDKEKYSLLLAALPSETVSGVESLFKGMGISLEAIELFEGMGGLSLSEFLSVLVFIRQEATWRVIWVKNSAPADTWRVADPGGVSALFAEMDFGETVDSALFYSEPEGWLVEACEENGLAVSETLDADDIFRLRGASVDMLPKTSRQGFVRRHIMGFAACFLIIAAAAMFSGGFYMNAKADEMRMRSEALSAQIRSLNDEAGGGPAAPPSDLAPVPSVYGRVMQTLTIRLPAGAHMQRASAEGGALSAAISANGSGWLNGYIDECESCLNMKIITSKISLENGLTEIELIIDTG